MTQKTKIYAVVGPTASGKSALALELAKRHGGEIISCDSMQIYKRMNIGTAKPTVAEQSAVRHHLIDIVEPDVDFSCEDYVAYAHKAIADCVSRGKIPIICGGTGLYLDTLLRGGNSAPVADTSAIRAELTARAEREGADAIYAELMRVDRESAEAIHPNNVKRVIRALEIYYSCGVPKSELDRASKQIEPRYDANVLMLKYADRDILYRRIEKRVDLMIAEGLLEETLALMQEGVFEKNGTAAQAIGYKELLGYLRGTESLEDAIAELKTATRRYAKRQITWFSAKDYVMPLEADSECGIKRFEEIVNNAEKLFSL
ncbi:MAG: tRNA (adenosine(37)-N6)-dimethylallyltransferase MiaA [Clostridia bacterium]|nr:tRNA (adenosine(37)-N6)-dimethylallyltransferase MiaA [Clostridia bacterium]